MHGRTSTTRAIPANDNKFLRVKPKVTSAARAPSRGRVVIIRHFLSSPSDYYSLCPFSPYPFCSPSLRFVFEVFPLSRQAPRCLASTWTAERKKTFSGCGKASFLSIYLYRAFTGGGGTRAGALLIFKI